MHDANMQAVRSDLKNLMRDAQSLFAEATAAGGSKADELRAKAMKMLDNAIDHAHEIQHISIEKGKKIAHDTDAYVHEHPWRAIGISAAVGLVIGMLIARR
jgi:ElaB/YqjD/DUF883 family membrane-anchored ribosome-binding protein